ncbi:MAG: FAD-dependent oxidoreductase [Verrucomicrobiota bacterium]|nr:FAD-dependent oxidoreductase [Verrucomicrobiota bacterium]
MIYPPQQISCECCVIGTGPAGLGAALELVNHGTTSVVVVDKNSRVGGLSRTDIMGGQRFDVGPHRFFSKSKEVNRIWRETLGEDFRPVSRMTRIFYRNKYFQYPIKPLDALTKLGSIESLEAALSYLFTRGRRGEEPAKTFEEWTTRNFGRKLYETFFKTYTEKVWGIPCDQIGAEWASQRIKGLNALEVIKNAFLGGRSNRIRTLVEQFDYPALGAGQMYEAMCERIARGGAEVRLNSRVVRVRRRDGRMTSIDVEREGRTTTITARAFFSSMPLAHFFRMMEPVTRDEAVDRLRYRDHITVNLMVGRPFVFPDQWIYVHSPEVQMARVANYKNFSEKMVADPGKTSLSVEYFVFHGQGLWNEPDESLLALAVRELDRMGIVKAGEVESGCVARETEAYPVYYLGYGESYERVKSLVDSMANLLPIGRAGMHKYNNQDHSLMSGLLAARNYLKLPGSPYALWDINIDAEYHEGGRRER